MSATALRNTDEVLLQAIRSGNATWGLQYAEDCSEIFTQELKQELTGVQLTVTK